VLGLRSDGHRPIAALIAGSHGLPAELMSTAEMRSTGHIDAPVPTVPAGDSAELKLHCYWCVMATVDGSLSSRGPRGLKNPRYGVGWRVSSLLGSRGLESPRYGETPGRDRPTGRPS